MKNAPAILINDDLLNPVPRQNRPGQNKNTFGIGKPLTGRAGARAVGYHSQAGVKRETQRLKPVIHPLAARKRYDLSYQEALEAQRRFTTRINAAA